MWQIKVKGLASGNIWTFGIQSDQLRTDLLSFLRAQGLPIASSCSGNGQCGKCVFNESNLSCNEIVKDWVGKEISFTYL